MVDLLSHNVLVISQKAKLVELTNEYKIHTEDGEEVGVIRQEGQSAVRKMLRVVSNVDAFLGIRLSLLDSGGTKVLGIERPAALWKSKVTVTDGSGSPIGVIAQRNVLGKIRFGLIDGTGQDLGEIRGENWRAWDFAILDASGQEVGRVNKKWAGIGKEMFTTADNYVIQLNEGLHGQLRMLALASGAAIDTVLKQHKG